MITSADILPLHAGYAMGNIIKKEDLFLPILHSRREAIENSLYQEIEKKRELEESETYRRLVQADKEASRMMMHSAAAKINRLRQEHEKICERIDQMGETSFCLPVEEMLPLDFSLSTMKIVNRGFQSERTAQLSFTKYDVSLNSRIQSFISRLLPINVPSNFLNSSEIESMTKNMNEMVAMGSRVFLVGSFISLDRVRIFDPLRLRRPSSLSETIKKTCSQYCVLTEAVLGAAFIGFGTHTEETEQLVGGDEETLSEVSRVAMSKISMLSFISHGAVLKIKSTLQQINLWDLYVNFKEILAENEFSGWPTGFKFRELTTILGENGVVVDSSGSPSTAVVSGASSSSGLSS